MSPHTHVYYHLHNYYQLTTQRQLLKSFLVFGDFPILHFPSHALTHIPSTHTHPYHQLHIYYTRKTQRQDLKQFLVFGNFQILYLLFLSLAFMYITSSSVTSKYFTSYLFSWPTHNVSSFSYFLSAPYIPATYLLPTLNPTATSKTLLRLCCIPHTFHSPSPDLHSPHYHRETKSMCLV